VEQLRELLKQLELHRLLEDLTPTAQWESGDYQSVGTWEALREIQERVRDRGSFALAGVTTDSNAVGADLIGLALGFEPGEVHYIPFREYADGSAALSREEVLETLRGVIEDPGIGIIGHDLKRLMMVLQKRGISMNGVRMDTMVASYLINPLRRSHELEAIALDYLDRRMTPIKERRSDLFKSACEEIDTTLSVSEVLVPRLEEEGLDALFQHLELPLIPVLATMEMAGVRVDVQLLLDLAKDLERQITALEHEVKQLAGEEFNINSHQQLGRILFEKLKLPVIKKTKTGYSTDVDVLRELSKGHDLPAKVLDYRSLGKLKSTYVDALPRLVNPETGRIHTSFNQAVTATGRLSSSDPNLQNIPIRSELGRQIRGAFVPKEGYWLLSADYSQIELRILAHLSKDPILLEAFQRDEDIHTRTAAEIFGVPPSEVVPEMRREAKVINFGIIYGMSAYGLARELDVGQKVAAAYIDGYFQRYKGVREFIDHVLAEAKEKGYVETMMKRRRYLPEIGSSNVGARRFAERTAINTPIQGTAADIIKKAMIEIQKRLDSEGLGSNMILQVHDELLFEVPDGEGDAMSAMVSEEMESAEALDVQLKVDVGWGRNWADAH
jgi:DNA polymerase-1